VVQATGISDEILLQRLKRLLRESVGRRGGAGDHRDRLIVTLSVIVEKEERFVLQNRTAYVAAKLVEVIVALRKPRPVAFPAIGIQRLVPEELKRRSMPVVSAALRNHIDHTTPRATDLRRVAVGGDLEFLHGILAEAVGASARSGASGRLPEEHVICVRAIH